MNWTTHVRSEFTRLGKSVDETVVEELAQHAAAAFAEARADGQPPDEAERYVRTLIASWCETDGPRRIVRVPLIEAAPAGSSIFAGLALDLRQAGRLVRRQPGVACLSLLMIALGIGVTSTLFSLVNGVLLKPLPWKTADRLVRVFENRSGMHVETDWAHRLTNISLNVWHDGPQTIDGVAGWREEELLLPGAAGAERIPTARVTTTLLPLLGESPLLGDNFNPVDASTGNAVILSYGFWQERFGGAHDVLGKPIVIGGRSRTIVGVMRRGFEFPTSVTRLWTPLELGAYYTPDGPNGGYRVELFDAIARLKPGVTAAQAAAEGSARLNAVTGDIRRMATDIFTAGGPASPRSRCSTGS